MTRFLQVLHRLLLFRLGLLAGADLSGLFADLLLAALGLGTWRLFGGTLGLGCCGRLFPGQTLGASRLGLVALQLLGQLLKGPGRFLHALARLRGSRLLVGRLLRLTGCLGGIRLPSYGFGGLQLACFPRHLLLASLQFLLFLRSRLGIGGQAFRLLGQPALLLGQLLCFLVRGLLTSHGLGQPFQLTAGLLLRGFDVLRPGVQQIRQRRLTASCVRSCSAACLGRST